MGESGKKYQGCRTTQPYLEDFFFFFLLTSSKSLGTHTPKFRLTGLQEGSQENQEALGTDPLLSSKVLPARGQWQHRA